MQPGARQVGEVVLGILPGVKDHRHVRAAAGRTAGRGCDRFVLAAGLADHGGELGDVGPSPG